MAASASEGVGVSVTIPPLLALAKRRRMNVKTHAAAASPIVHRSGCAGATPQLAEASCTAMSPGAKPVGVTVTIPPLVAFSHRRRLRAKKFAAVAPPTYRSQHHVDTEPEPTPAYACEASVDPAAQLLALLRLEVEQVVVQLEAASLPALPRGKTPCPLCPWYAFTPGSEDAHRHFTAGHAVARHFVCSGTKQLRMCMSMYEADMYQGNLPGNYMTRTSQILRTCVEPSPPKHLVTIDAYIRVVHDSDGPRIKSLVSVGADPALRRVGNFIYTKGFAECMLREVCLSRGNVSAAVTRLQLSFLLQGNKLGGLMPEHSKTMAHVVQDVMDSRPIKVWQDALLDSAYTKGEFDVLTIDGTMKIAMGLMGYDRGVAAHIPGKSVWGLESTRPRVLTTRGASGFVVGASIVTNEAAPVIAAALEAQVTRSTYMHKVRYIVADHCTRELWCHMKETFPNLVCTCEDTVHLVMKVKGANGGKATPASRLLSKIMAKFNTPWLVSGRSDDMPPFIWASGRQRTHAEQRVVEYMKT